MEDTLNEAKAALVKSKDDMAKYYDQRRTPALEYQPKDRVYLDTSDIHTTRPSWKLSHQRLGPFLVIRKVRNSAYCLHLPPSMSRLHPVFNVVKLTLAPEDPVPGQHLHPPPLLEIINREEEFIVEEILDSRVITWKLHYLVMWEGYRIKHNSWEPADNVHTPECVMYFHQKHPRAPHHIQFVDFNTIPFQMISSAVPRHHSLEGGMDVRGHSFQTLSPMEYVSPPYDFRHILSMQSLVHPTTSPVNHLLLKPTPFVFPSHQLCNGNLEMHSECLCALFHCLPLL